LSIFMGGGSKKGVLGVQIGLQGNGYMREQLLIS
jgi:hypothetical protein